MKELFVKWKGYIADLMRQERFTLAAAICVGTGVLVLGAVSLVLVAVIHVSGFKGYMILLLVVAFLYIRYVLKDWYNKFMKDDTDNETGVS